ncbi:MAG: glycosyltransferase [Bacteroidales bacterium]|nr:glycosyltransferase [Bacteroidales bacterium]
MLNRQTKIFVTVPLMDEAKNIPAFLACLKSQTYKNFKLIACVNQPESFRSDPAKASVYYSNQKTLEILFSEKSLDLQIVDRSSQGKGWVEKKFGVGWARKVAMDAAALQANKDDIIVSMDGDTIYDPKYLESVLLTFVRHSSVKAISIPYYHKLTGNIEEDRAVLRYEIYMRYFALNLLRINNPYAFTAIGSAMACTVDAYRGIRGITPHKSGEDFYFIQKLRKYGDVVIYMDETAFPAARFSDRVFFGTGPAMIKGNAGDWTGYPIYPSSFFDEIKSSFDSFGDLFQKDFEIPMSTFLLQKFGGDIWQELRKNSKTKDKFIRACIQKVDGLRTLQYLKWRNQSTALADENNLIFFLDVFYPDELLNSKMKLKNFTFDVAGIECLNEIRNFLFEKETQWRKKIKILQ